MDWRFQWAYAITFHHLSSLKFSHFAQLHENSLNKFKQTWQKWCTQEPLQKIQFLFHLCKQDGHQMAFKLLIGQFSKNNFSELTSTNVWNLIGLMTSMSSTNNPLFVWLRLLSGWVPPLRVTIEPYGETHLACICFYWVSGDLTGMMIGTTLTSDKILVLFD